MLLWLVKHCYVCYCSNDTYTELSACFWVNLQRTLQKQGQHQLPPLSSTSIWTPSTFSEIFVTKPIFVSLESFSVPPPSYVYVLRSHPVTCSLPCKCWWVRSQFYCSGFSLNFCGRRWWWCHHFWQHLGVKENRLHNFVIKEESEWLKTPGMSQEWYLHSHFTPLKPVSKKMEISNSGTLAVATNSVSHWQVFLQQTLSFPPALPVGFKELLDTLFHFLIDPVDIEAY